MSLIFQFLQKKYRRFRLFLRLFVFKNYSEADRWFWECGDDTFRLNYPLDSNSLVLDLGGYKGEWTEKIYRRYEPRILVFEPVSTFQHVIAQKFEAAHKVRLYPFGLGGTTHTDTIFLNDNGSSTHLSTGMGKEQIQIVGITEFFEENALKEVDLMKINIEGEEFSLLETMLKNGLHTRVRAIQVQFHPWIEDAENRRQNIRATLSKTHCLTYDFPFVWENWQRIEP